MPQSWFEANSPTKIAPINPAGSWFDSNSPTTNKPKITTPNKKPVPTITSRLEQMAEGIYGMGKQVIFGGADPMTNAMMGGMRQGAEMAANPAYEGASGKAKGLAEIAGIPVSNLQEDYETGAWGAGALDLGQTALSLFGMKEGLAGLKAKPKALPTVVPDVTPVTPPEPPALPPVDTSNVAKLGKPPSPWDWNLFDQGKTPVADPYNTPRAQGIQRISPGTTSVPNVKVGPIAGSTPKVGSLGLDLGAEGSLPTGEVSSSRPNVKSETKIVKVKYRDKNGRLRTKEVEVPVGTGEASEGAIKGKVISGEKASGDFLDENPLYQTVPNRLRPEAPNVAALRNLSEGTPKVEPIGTLPSVDTSVVDSSFQQRAQSPTIKERLAAGRPNRLNFVNQADYLAEQAAKNPIKNPIETVKEAINPEVEPVDTSDKGIGKVPVPELPGARGVSGLESFMNKNPTLKAAFQSWMRNRAAGKHIGLKTADDFAPQIGNIPKENIVEFQKAIEAGKFPEVRKWFDDIHKKMTDAGVPVDYKYNYLPQLWEESPEFVKTALGEKRLSTKAPFTYESIFKDYEVGMKVGKLTPKMSPLELMKWYSERSNRLIADTQMWNHLKEQGLVQLKGTEGTQGLPTLNPDLLPGGFGQKGRNYVAPSNVKFALENYLQGPNQNLAGKMGRISSRTTGTVLAGGAPKTPILQFHGINTLVNSFLEGGPKRAWTAIKAGLPTSEEAKIKYWKDNRDVTIQAVKDGINIKTPDTAYRPVFENSTNLPAKVFRRIDNLQNEYFRKPLFEHMIPKIMLEAYKDRVSRGISGTQAASDINTMYGHLNLDDIFRDKHFQDVAKSFLFAPAWLESRVRMLDLTNPTYQKAAGAAAATYAAANVLNVMTSGKPMWNNDIGHEFDIAAGKRSDGSTRYINLSNAFDAYKAPLEIAADVVKGGDIQEVADLAKNKASVPMKLGLDLVTGFDRQGNPLVTRPSDKFGNPVPAGKRLANTLADVSTSVSPPLVKSGVNFATSGDAEKALAESLQLPVRYKTSSKKVPSFNMHVPTMNFPKPKGLR